MGLNHRNHPESLVNLRILISLTLVLNLVALYEVFRHIQEKAALSKSPGWVGLLGLMAVCAILEILLLALTYTPLFGLLKSGHGSLMRWLGRFRFVSAFLALGCILVYPWLVLGPYQQFFVLTASRLLIFWLIALVASLFLMAWGPFPGFAGNWGKYLATSVLLATFCIKVASFLPEVSTYPFSLGWSEASRYYYASLFLSKQIYGFDTPPSVLHPSRYLLQAIPYLISGSPLWLHRAWQVFLWLATTFVTSALLARRLGLRERVEHWLFIMWSFLFLLIGPVYYHLQIPVILVLALYRWDSRRSTAFNFVRALAVVLLASIWAGISRINWFPVPGMLAAAIYFLEVPVQKKALSSQAGVSTMGGWGELNTWLYGLVPVAWTLAGTGAAFATQALYIRWSGNVAEQFTTSFSSDLLWYRLFPNQTYPPGILLAILLVSLPLFLLMAQALLARRGGMHAWRSYHSIRWLGLGVMLAVLFLGGLIVSLKIGGGSNLHNFDAYLVLLLLTASYIFFERSVPDIGPEEATAQESPAEGHPTGESWQSRLRQAGLILALIVPAVQVIIIPPAESLEITPQKIQGNLSTLVNYTEEASRNGGEVLFISQRHLLPFGYVQNVPLVPEYEQVFLMEMAMAGDPSYLQRFYDDLESHRFALIVSDPLTSAIKDRDYRFNEENNVWVKRVSRLILCYYEPVLTMPKTRIQLLVPKPQEGECP